MNNSGLIMAKTKVFLDAQAKERGSLARNEYFV
jgi:hypothetical protein